MANLYIGLMSGTSADSIDAAIIDFSSNQPQLIASHEQALTPVIKQTIAQLATSGAGELDITGELDRELGILFASCANELLKNNNINASDIQAIGSHGQTVRHRPVDAQRSSDRAFTLQLGDPNTIAELTGITTVADFRRRDITVGGQGAPLAPAFHQAVFASPSKNRAVVNIGGMSNISVLSKQTLSSGYDTGPGNVLMDGWIHRHLQKHYDDNGSWATSGSLNQALLDDLLTHPFFAQAAPKSTGREDFNLSWLDSVLVKYTLDAADVQATLLELTAITIANELTKIADLQEIFICGGGAFNGALITRLEALIHPIPLASTESLGIQPQWVEACAFAWLAKQCLAGKPANCPAVTGASKAVVLGSIFPV